MFNVSQVMEESDSPSGEVFEASEIQPIDKREGLNTLLQSQDTLRHIGELNDDLQGGKSSKRLQASAQELETTPADLATQLFSEDLPQTQHQSRRNNRRGVTLKNLDFDLMDSVPEDVANEDSMINTTAIVNTD